LSICALFLRVVEWCFLGVFRENWCANVVFLHGKCGEVVVKTWWETDIKSALKNETGFQGLFSV
jgi:hypothetical protein